MEINNEPNFDVINQALSESQHPVLQQLKDQIASLTNSIEEKNKTIEQNNFRIDTLRRQHDSFVEILKSTITELYNEKAISESAATRICEDLDIEITSYVEVSGTVSFSGKVQVSIFENIHSVRPYDFSSQLDISYDATGESLEDFDYDIEDVDLTFSY